MIIAGEEIAEPAKPLEMIAKAEAERVGDRMAVTGAGSQVTWRELDERANALASSYIAIGLEPGDRLASLMPNRVELLVHYLACFKAGIVTVPLNYRYTALEVDHALQVSGAAALIAHAERSEDILASRAVPSLAHGVISFEGQVTGGTAELVDLFDPHHASQRLPGSPDAAAPAAIFFTSGSTGPSKGVTHSHETLRWMFASACAAIELSPADAFMAGSSMSHLGAFLCALASLTVGASVVVVRAFDGSEILPMLRECRPTVLTMLPAALLALVRHHDARHDDFSSLRLVRCAGDLVSRELIHEFASVAGFAVDEAYGMTELGIATLNPPRLIKDGSLGRPIPGFAIALRDDENRPVGTAQVGRMWIRTRSQMIGYWNDPVSTEEVLEDGWLDSGDLARADSDGYLWFFGRKKQVIVHDGSNISPFEVESALMDHPCVGMAAVVGIRDALHGENVRGYITVKEDTTAPSSQELIAFCRERVGYKAPEEIVVLDEMPTTATGKLDRTGLKRLAERHLHPHGLEQ